MTTDHPATVAIVGGGPAGLMAAEVIACSPERPVAPLHVALFDAMPSLGRKFLMAGKGGLNITHAEPIERFLTRYGAQGDRLASCLEAFGPSQLRAWMQGLGIDSFVGSSGRVFPSEMKAAPLLRAWLHRLRETAEVSFHVRHRWHGIERLENNRYRLHFTTPEGEHLVEAEAVVLALGGGSWAKLGSDGRWVPVLEAIGIPVAPLRPANCGFDVAWSDYLRQRFAGQPVKNIGATVLDANGQRLERRGELTITVHGIEGGLVYTFSAWLRDVIERDGQCTLTLDLLPEHRAEQVLAATRHPRGSRSLASHLQSRLGLKGVKLALLHECLPREAMADPGRLAAAIKALPLTLTAPRPLDEAISSAGGVSFNALDEQLMLRNLPGVFCAGEMLDWEAPTGGYLLTGCLATGRAVGKSVLQYWQSRREAAPLASVSPPIEENEE